MQESERNRAGRVRHPFAEHPIPTREHIVGLMKKAAERIPAERLWVNPDCGLKTRRWAEVIPALTNMVAAAKTLRNAVR